MVISGLVARAMKILLAEDDPVQRRLIQSTLRAWGYTTEVCEDGSSAWARIESGAAPNLIILDWVMPGMDGVEICRRLRAQPTPGPRYVMLLTARGEIQDVVQALEAGADDYIQKPFHPEEFRARVRNASRIIELQRSLSARIGELESALARVNQLQGLLPICCYCKKIRSDENYWTQVESYFAEHSDLRFSHGICPSCYERVVAEDEGLAEGD